MATIQTIQTFKTSDGKAFNSYDEAVAHEAYLEKAEVIEAYIAHAGMKAPQAGTFRRHIPGFESFQKSYVPGTFKLPAKDEAAKADAPAEGAAE